MPPAVLGLFYTNDGTYPTLDTTSEKKVMSLLNKILKCYVKG